MTLNVLYRGAFTMLTRSLESTLNRAIEIASGMKHEYVTIEHLLLSLVDDEDVASVLNRCKADINLLRKSIMSFLSKNMSNICCYSSLDPKPTIGFNRIMNRAMSSVKNMGKSLVSGASVLNEMFAECDSHSVLFLREQSITCADVISYVLHDVIFDDDDATNDNSNHFHKHKPEDDFIYNIQNHAKKSNDNVSSAIKEYCVNLNKKAISGKIDPLIDRSYEINRTLDILSRRMKNNPIYVGAPGVGKTAIVEGLAHKIVSGNVPASLSGLIIYSLDIGALIAGTRYRGDFEERVRNVVKEMSSIPNSVLFIDEIHVIVGAGSTNGNALDAGNLLKPALSRGCFRCIGATTYNEYKTVFSKDSALCRRFQKVEVIESTVEETIRILDGLKSKYESYHKISYTKEAIRSAVKLSDRYIFDRSLPDKAIDLLDEAGAHFSINGANKISSSHIAKIVSNISSIPCSRISQSERKMLVDLESSLKSEIFGQDDVIREIVSLIKISKSGLRDPNKPFCSLLFCGSSGTGKTELAKALAKHMDMNLIRYDMSEYMEAHSVSKMIGSPPGYVGHDVGGLLTEEVSKKHHSIVLFDEIEKAHKDICNIFLQIMDYGYATDSSGKSVNFRNTIIIMTSNLGANEGIKSNMGFGSLNGNNSLAAAAVANEFSSEFRNRLDGIMYFKSLSPEAVNMASSKMIGILNDRLHKNHNIKVELDSKVYDHFVKVSCTSEYGVRAIDRIINKSIISILADSLLFQEKSNKDGVMRFTIKNDDITLV